MLFRMDIRKSNKFFIFLLLILFTILHFCVNAQQKKNKLELEKTKQENHRKILEVEKILKETKVEKRATLGELRALKHQIETRKSLIKSIGEEIKLLNGELSDLSIVVTSLQRDLKTLKKEYAQQIYLSYKANRGNVKLMFLFSAKSFNQLLKRLKYLELYSDARKLQAQQITIVTSELQTQRDKVKSKKTEHQALLKEQIKENRTLNNSRKRQVELIAELTKREKELRIEVARRKEENRQLNTLIAQHIESNKAKTESYSLAVIASTAEITRQFELKKNKLTWPVRSGFIASKFGEQPHPILKKIKVVNHGVAIQTQKNTEVKAVFDGVVTRVVSLKGKNNVVVVRHGDYLTVYAKLKSIDVQVGQKVKINDILGEVYTNNDGISELEFQLYKGFTKLDPEKWLAMK